LNSTQTSGEIHGLTSIIVPAFNCAAFLAGCIDSVSRQSDPRWELLLIDDGSTDNTPAMADDYAERDPRIKVFHTANAGPGAARNIGLQQARGEFTVFLDADDALEPQALAELKNEFSHPDVDLAVAGYSVINAPDGRVLRQENFLGKSIRLDHEQVLDYLIEYNLAPNRRPMFSYIWGKMYRSAVIKANHLEINAGLKVFEDTEFNFRFLKHARSVACRSECFYRYTTGYLSPTTGSRDFAHKITDPLCAMTTLGKLLRQRWPDAPVEAVIGNGVIVLMIIQSIRLSGQLNPQNRAEIIAALNIMINEPLVRRCLPYYVAGAKGSRWIPRLIKWKMTTILCAVCRYKAFKRYGNLWKKA